MTRIVSATDWLDAGLAALTREGPGAVRADRLARGLGVSRGSFYWHFADLAAFHAAMLERWRDQMLTAVITRLEQRAGSAADRLGWLVAQAFAADPARERAVRGWAMADEGAGRAAAAVDAARITYIEGMLVEAGLAPGTAALRARLVYQAWLGRVVMDPAGAAPGDPGGLGPALVALALS
jgi:AcrR family transcriptional regulator